MFQNNFLGNNGLTGVDVGDALVEASAIPEPTGAIALALTGLIAIRRRK